MINNNPYNIPEKPLKQSKVIHQNHPFFPHQINRRNEEQHKIQQHHLLKRSTIPHFIENTVCQVVHIPMSPQPTIKHQPLQMSNVTHWQGRQNVAPNLNILEINDRIQSFNSRLQAQQRRLCKILDMGKYQISTNLGQSTTLYQDTTLHGCSKQLQKYQNSDQSIDRVKEEMSCFWSKNEKLNEILRKQMKQQKQSITHEILLSFKQCLNEKFVEEQKKIAEWISSVNGRNQQKINQLKKTLQSQLITTSNANHLKHREMQEKMKQFSTILKQKIQETMISFDQFKSNFNRFKEEVFDNILATQDHKHWLFQLDKAIKQIQNSHFIANHLSKGMLKVSKDNCHKQAYHLRYEQYINIPEISSGMSIRSEQRTYLVDEQGYLLDGNRYYIVDKQDNRIRVGKQQLQKLRYHGLMI